MATGDVEPTNRVPRVALTPEGLAEIMERAEYELLGDDEGWFASIPEFQGLWGHGATRASSRADLESSLPEWISLGVAKGHELPKAAQNALATGSTG